MKMINFNLLSKNNKVNQRFPFVRIFPNSNKGVSPMIATVLLIGMVVVIALIIFLWFKGFSQEAIVKFDKNVELVCDKVKFEASYSGDTLAVSNIGNVPVYNIKVKILENGNFETKDLNDLSSNWKNAGLNPGRVFSDDISSSIGSADSVTLTPVLVGSSEKGERTFTCNEARYGHTINL